MLVTPVQWDSQARPTLFTSGRVFTWVGNRRVFVGVYTEPTVAAVCAMAHLNSKVAALKAGLASKMRVAQR